MMHQANCIRSDKIGMLDKVKFAEMKNAVKDLL